MFFGKSVITVLDNGSLVIMENGKQVVFTKEQSVEFKDEENGETVTEYSGLATDNRADRSWAKAVFLPATGSSAAHYHNDKEETYYVVAGTAKLIIDGQEKILIKGEQVIINKGQIHQVINLSPDKPLELVVKCTPSWHLDDHHLVEIREHHHSERSAP